MTTIEQLAQVAKQNAEQNGNHVDYEVNALVMRSITRTEAVEAGASLSGARFEGMTSRLATGIHNRTGETLSESQMGDTETALRKALRAVVLNKARGL